MINRVRLMAAHFQIKSASTGRQLRYRRAHNSAVTALEYAFLAALVAGVIVVSLKATGVSISGLFSSSSLQVANSMRMPGYANCDSPVESSFFGSYACGYSGINGPPAPINPLVSARYDDYTNSAGQTVVYSTLLQGSLTVGTGSQGAAFTDGYTLNAADVSEAGITFATFSNSCSTGAPLDIGNGFGLANEAGAPLTYAPGVPTKDASGNFICGYSSITSGSLY